MAISLSVPPGPVLAATIVSVRVAVPPLYKPPASLPVEFPEMVQATTVSWFRVGNALAELFRPPTNSAEFPLMVQLVRYPNSSFSRPPPYSAEFPLMVLEYR